MLKPMGYDEAEAQEGGFRQPGPGPCILGITGVQMQKNSSGEQQLLFYIDIAEGVFKNYYRRLGERFKSNRFLRHYQNCEGKSLPHFKGIIKAIEEGNPGYKFDFNESSLLYKKIGGNLREEEYERRDGSIGVALRVAYLCSIRSVQTGEHKILPLKKFTIPEVHYSPAAEPPKTVPTQVQLPVDGFNQTPPEEDLPF